MFFFCSIRTEVKHASTPLKVNLKMQLQKQQMEEQQQRNMHSQPASTGSQSVAINMPVTVNALTSDLPHKVVQVGVSSRLLASSQ